MGDNDRDVADGEKSAPRDGPRSKRRMRDKIVISTVVAFCISSWLSPPDAATALVLGSGSAFLCGAALLILARSNFMKSLSPSMQAVVCILVCILSVLAVHASALYRTAGRINRPSDFASVSSSGSLSFGDLWIAHLSDRRGFWSRETECVICSADPPKTWGYGRATCRLTFSDEDSVEVKLKNKETVWIDKQHRVTFLGPVLGKEDVSLLRSHGYDKKYRISSADELLAIVEKLRAEQAASTAPLKAAS